MDNNDFTVKKELEDIDSAIFNRAYEDFKSNVEKVIGDLLKFLHKDTIIKGYNKRAFLDAIRNRPVVYSGGGSNDPRLRQSILESTDIKFIDKQFLEITNIIDEHRINIPYSVLATSFGLSIQRQDDNILMSNKEDLFAWLLNIDEKESRWNAHLEHGMYED